MTSLVTGMAGFVGRHIAGLLREAGEECAGFDRPGGECPDPDCAEIDLLDLKSLEDFIRDIKPQKIFHLAAQSGVARSWKDPEGTFRLNVVGTLNLLEAVKNNAPSARIILVSSGEVYGLTRPDGRPLTENDEPRPQNPYALSKLAAEFYAGLYSRLHRVDAVMVRPLGHTGPGQARGFVAPDFAGQIADIKKGKRGPVIKVGNLESRREFMDVRDVARAYAMLAEKGAPGEVYNLASGRLYSVREMLDTLLDISGVEVKVETDPALFRPADTEPLRLDSSKLIEATGWKTLFDLRSTLSDLLDYFSSEGS